MIMLGKHATAKQMKELRTELGLDKPAHEQYFDIVKSAFGLYPIEAETITENK